MLDPHQEGFEKLVAMIEALAVGMLTTEEENGGLRSRPMTTQRAEKGVLWLFRGKKLENVKKDAQVNVRLSAGPQQRGLRVCVWRCTDVPRSGKGPRALEQRRPAMVYGRAGRPAPDDLKVEIMQAEYWDVDKRAMIQLLDKGATGGAEILSATDHKKFS